MRNAKYWLLAALAVSLVGVGVAEEKKEDKKPLEIKAIMKKAHTAPKGEDPLCKRVASGSSTEAEAKDLLALYEDLAKNKPPKGDEESWKKKTSALVSATKDIVGKKEGATDAYKKALNCMACHEAHRPPKGDK
jgi:hypothetical protein